MNTGPTSGTRQRPDGPRRVRHGIKVKRLPGSPMPWTATSWLGAFEQLVPTERRDEGLEYARAGQIVTLAIEPPSLADDADATTLVRAAVQGRAARPYATTLGFRAWNGAQWSAGIDAMAREAIYGAKLLAGDVPASVDEMLREIGQPLGPVPGETVTFACTCGSSQPCKHGAAAALLIVERLADQPLTIFELRGLSGQGVLQRLQEARSILAHGRSAAHGASPLVEVASAAPALDAMLNEFWRPGPSLHAFEEMPTPEHVSHALLRRLGPSPLQGKFPLVGLLASIYDEVKAAALKLERTEDGDASNDG
ncbi:MAG: hypothetical protein KDA22_15650 [Phycisphaerales bacterium]|nr:hypothetical protein [Phycisphaerales bacterium]